MQKRLGSTLKIFTAATQIKQPEMLAEVPDQRTERTQTRRPIPYACGNQVSQSDVTAIVGVEEKTIVTVAWLPGRVPSCLCWK